MWAFHLERVVVQCGLEGLLGAGKLEGNGQPVTDGERRRGLSSWFQQHPPPPTSHEAKGTICIASSAVSRKYYCLLEMTRGGCFNT